MAQTNILLEAGTNELEVVEFYLDEADPLIEGDEPAEGALLTEGGERVYRGYYGVNVAKVLEIIRMPKVTELPEVQHPSVLGAFNLRSRIIPLVDLAMWLGKTHVPVQEQPKTIVTEFNNVTTAFMVSGSMSELLLIAFLVNGTPCKAQSVPIVYFSSGRTGSGTS